MKARPAGAGVGQGAEFLGYREVVRMLGGCTDETRDAVLGAWSGDRDRWGRKDWEAMADALTRREDALELRRGLRVQAERGRLRVVRRALEGMVEP